MLDRFELVAELASGGMATVFLARLEGVAGFSRLYAIKRLHPHIAHEREFVDMFLDEARLAARIHHPNVVPILEVGNTEQGYYLVMEYVEGDTAAHFMTRAVEGASRLPIPCAVRIALDALAGLHAAHDLTDDDSRPLEIVHRDVSPQNILVGIDGASRITDFGVAHAATRLSTTRTGQLKGKLAYMAPEQARSVPVDRRVDVWAMGVVLWEMLTGTRLFKAQNDAQTLNRILFTRIPTPEEACKEVPAALSAVCMRALERDTVTRFSTAAEFSEELERVARALGVLGTARDVAAHMDDTIGPSMTQQREMLRTWMTRSSTGAKAASAEPTLTETPAAATKGRPPTRRVSSTMTSVRAEAPSAAPPLVEPTRTLMIIDDSATTRNLVRVYLMGMGFEFVEAGRADQALVIVSSRKVDLVIADVNMPGMGGLTFLRAVRKLPDPELRRVPIVLLTSDKSPDTRTRALAAGATGFVLKPVTSSNLREAVTMLLRQVQTQVTK